MKLTKGCERCNDVDGDGAPGLLGWVLGAEIEYAHRHTEQLVENQLREARACADEDHDDACVMVQVAEHEVVIPCPNCNRDGLNEEKSDEEVPNQGLLGPRARKQKRAAELIPYPRPYADD